MYSKKKEALFEKCRINIAGSFCGNGRDLRRRYAHIKPVFCTIRDWAPLIWKFENEVLGSTAYGL